MISTSCLWSRLRLLFCVNLLFAAVSLWAVLPTVTIAPTVNAAEPGTDGEFTLTRDGSTTNPLTVTYTVTGTAMPGADYVAPPGTVTFLADEATATVAVAVLDDDLVENLKSVSVTVTADAGYLVGSPASATVTLTSDDLGGLLTVGSNTYGQLGDGTNTNSSTPVQIQPYGVKAAAAGNYHSVYLKNDG